MAEKSLDDRIKEVELAIKEAELKKLKEETTLVRKQVNAKWYSGRQLAKVTGVVLTTVALYSVIDQVFLKDIREAESRIRASENRLVQLRAEVAQAALDSLNREKKKITATIDSLKIRAILSAAFGNLDSLEYAYLLKQYNIIKSNNYFDRRLNPTGTGIENDFKIQVIEGNTVIYDAPTGLTWQGGNEFPRLAWVAARDSVENLVYAGFDDWRLPTWEEAMSLIEPDTNKAGLSVNPLFNDTPIIWTADKYDTLFVWGVSFFGGFCLMDPFINPNYYLRAVRSGQ